MKEPNGWAIGMPSANSEDGKIDPCNGRSVRRVETGFFEPVVRFINLLIGRGDREGGAVKRKFKDLAIPVTRKTIVYSILFLLGWSILTIWSVQEILMIVVERATKRAIAEECSRYEDYVKNNFIDSNTNEYAVAERTQNSELWRNKKL